MQGAVGRTRTLQALREKLLTVLHEIDSLFYSNMWGGEITVLENIPVMPHRWLLPACRRLGNLRRRRQLPPHRATGRVPG